MKNTNAFTLVELIIVISIVALLSTIGITTYSSVQKDARNVRRKADLKEMKTALEAYKAKNSDYPPTVGLAACPDSATVGDGDWCGICTTYNVDGTNTDTGASGYIPGLAPEFIPKLPRDPRESKINSSSAYPLCTTDAGSNCYIYNSNGTDYKLLAYCTPEGTMSSNDPYYDSARPDFAWQVTSSFGAFSW